MNIYRTNDFIQQPWKNGGGVTTELFRIPHASDPSHFHFRLSMANVSQSGPFSTFPGIDRHLLLLNGPGFILRRHGLRDTALTTILTPIAFSGEEHVECDVKGPSLDFNVMTERNYGRAEVEVKQLALGDQVIPGPGATTFLYLIEKHQLVQLMSKTWLHDTDLSTVIIVRLTRSTL